MTLTRTAENNQLSVQVITPDFYNDDFVADCARISFKNAAENFTGEQNSKLRRYLYLPPGGPPHWSPFAGPRIQVRIPWPHERDAFHFFSHAKLAGFSWEIDGLLRHVFNGSLWAWVQNLHYFPRGVKEVIRSNLWAHFPDCCEIMRVAPTNETHHSVVWSTNPKVVYENLRLRCPIYIARQLDKHQVHFLKNEVSRRYVRDVPELFIPHEYHRAPVSAKQGASAELYDTPLLSKALAHKLEGRQLYVDLVEDGMAPEEARGFLDQSMITEWIWTASLDGFARLCEERLVPTAQGTSQLMAEMIDQVLSEKHGENWRNRTHRWEK